MSINKKTSRWIVGITGASGAVYGIRLIEQLLQLQYQVHLVVSDAGWRVIKEELGIEALRREITLQQLFGAAIDEGQLIYYPNGDIGAAIASGSFQNAGMIIMPCSMGTLASIAHGISNNLMARAADVALKEKRNVIIVPRETPLHAIHLENMTRLAKLGAHIVPAMPAFYFGPKSLDDIISFMVGKVLDAANIEHSLYRRWKEEEQ